MHISLQQLTENLGFSLTEGASSLFPSSTESLSKTDKALPLNIDLSFISDEGEVLPLETCLRDYLNQHQEDIEKIILHLISHSPHWQRPPLEAVLKFPDNLSNQDSINYGKLSYLHRLLLVTSLDYIRQDKPNLANQSLIAAWNLMCSMADQPLGLSVSMLRDQAKALRYINEYSAEWENRWASVNPLKNYQALTVWPLINARLLKSAVGCEFSSPPLCVKPVGLQELLYPVIKPYFVFAAVDFLRRTKRLSVQDPCIRPLKSFINYDDLEERPVLMWNSAYAFYAGSQRRILRGSLLAWELTNKVFPPVKNLGI